MTASEILDQLKVLGNEGTKNILKKHGAKEPFFGVKIGDLKPIQKKIKKDHALALELYETGNSDAMYLAGLIADEKQITKAQLNDWIGKAYWYMLSEYIVAQLTSESQFGWELGLEWIESDDEMIAAAGWSTLANLASIKNNDELDVEKYEELLEQVGDTIHDAKNRVRYAMNGFVISTGSYIDSLTEKSKEIASKIGKVHVDVGGTACKVPLATDYIQKIIDKDRIGKKRKVARC
ncbi:MAG: DNA alkylation repair protein [bacterium]|nr:DNA alkylation repair protein [bacterium]